MGLNLVEYPDNHFRGAAKRREMFVTSGQTSPILSSSSPTTFLLAGALAWATAAAASNRLLSHHFPLERSFLGCSDFFLLSLPAQDFEDLVVLLVRHHNGQPLQGHQRIGWFQGAMVDVQEAIADQGGWKQKSKGVNWRQLRTKRRRWSCRCTIEHMGFVRKRKEEGWHEGGWWWLTFFHFFTSLSHHYLGHVK